MVGPNFYAAARTRRERLRAGSSSIAMGAVGALALANTASGFEMVADGKRFVRLNEGMFEIDTDTQTALLSMDSGSVSVPAEHYEILGDDVYVSKEFASVELAQAMGAAPNLLASPPGFFPGSTAFSVPLLGLAGATAFYLLQPGTLRFDNSNTALAYENETPVTFTPIVNRRDGETLTYTLTGDGADDALFEIDGASGRLSFKDAPNYENPEDRNDDNIYSVEIRTSDGDQTATQTVSITLIDINEVPSWVSGDAGTASENSTATSYTALASDPDTDDTLTYSLSGDGPDDDLFTIDETTGALLFRAAADFEIPGDSDGDNAYVIQLVVTDGRETAKQDVTVVLSNVNEAPTLTSGLSGSMDENGTTTTYTAAATDVDAGDTQTYSIVVQGADDSFFLIDPTTGVVRLNGALDYENPSDQNADGDYEFSIQVQDTAGAVDTVAVSMTLQDVNEAPVFENAGPFSVQENTTAGGSVGDSNANDGDGGTTDADLTYSITGGTGFGLFEINLTTGAITVKNSGTLDYETTASYTVDVTATDVTDTALTTVQSYTITITDQNEAPEFDNTNTLSIAEGATSPTLQASVTDPEGDSITWSIVGGADLSKFGISSSGELSLNAAQDFENPQDGNTDNQYLVTIQADDGTNQSTQEVLVDITDVNEAPSFSSGDSSLQNENTTTTGYVAAATDPEGATLTYSIPNTGADQGKFNIDPTTGTLTFLTPPDAENPTDADGQNDYVVDIQVSDGQNTSVQTVTVDVSDINEAPEFGNTNTLSIAEGATSPTLQASVTDPEGDSITWSIVGGADLSKFGISSSGELSLNAAQDFENPQDGNTDNQYLVTIQADDGTNQSTQEVLVDITDVNEAPSFSSGDSSLQNENTTTTGYVAAATDPEGATLTYSIPNTGADQGKFNIDPTTGTLTFLTPPDAENPTDADGQNDYVVDIQVSDGQNTSVQTVTVDVSDINEAPEFTSANNDEAIENSLSTSYIATGTDPDSDSLSFSLANTGEDDGLFSIDPTTGALRFLAEPNFENPGSFDGDNIYDIDIVVSDGLLSDTENVLITVTNANEAPVLAASSTTDMVEGQLPSGFSASATDIDVGDGQAYSLAASSGTNDNALLQIAPTTGAVSFLSEPSFDAPNSYLSSNVYTVDVIVTDDGGAQDAQTYFINVQDDI